MYYVRKVITSMQDLVDAMQINRSSLYNTIGDKHNLFIKCVTSYSETIILETKEIIVNENTALQNVIAIIREKALWVVSCDKGCLGMKPIFEIAVKDLEVRSLLNKNSARYLEILSNLIQNAIDNGELNKNLVVKRTVATNLPDPLVISFHNVFASRKDAELHTNKQFNKKQLPSIQVVSGNMDSEMFFPSTSNFNAIIIAVNVDYLKKLLNNHLDKFILKTIVSNNQSYLFEELMSPAIQKVASEIVEVEIPLEIQTFYFRVKAEELICLMITELIKRESIKVQ